MSEDSNNRDDQKSRREAKRQARIEEKRRKLAEQRAGRAETARAAEEQGRSIEPASGHAAGSEASVSGAHGSDSIRPVTADSANRERRIRLPGREEPAAEPAKESREDIAAKSRENPAAKSGVNPAAENREDPTAAAAEARRAEKAARRKEKSAKRRAAIWSFIKRSLRKFGKNIISSPAYAVKCLFALVVLVGIVYGALQLADYYDNKTDYVVTDEGYSHAERFDDCVALNGIDISEHREGKIEWSKVKTSGVDFVIIRAGYRAADDGSLHADKNFARNVKAASKAGLMVGAYFYSQALTPQEGREEAEFVLDMVKDYDITMPLVIDYEIYPDGRLDKKIQAGELYAASFYHDIVLGFTNTVEAAGYESAVYANRDMLTNYMQADLLDDVATIWLARYDSVANLDADYMFWQCSENGRAGGIEDEVDQDFWYVEPGRTYESRAKSIKGAVSIGDCRISFQRSKTKLKSFRAEPKYAMTYEGKGMNEGRDYVSSVIHNTRAGTGYIIIRGIGKYKDWIMYPFEIED